MENKLHFNNSGNNSIAIGYDDLMKHTTGSQCTPLGTSHLYFTPSIEDIRVGYECEMRQAGIWEFYRVPYNDCLSDYADMDGIRVSYLTKEQIEAESFCGWTGVMNPERTYPKLLMSRILQRGPTLFLHIELDFETHTLKIIKEGEGSPVKENILFDGKCRCINDFRLIVKLLGL